MVKQCPVSSAPNKKLIITVEEHNVIGGLGSSIADIVSSVPKSAPLIKIGVEDRYDKGGSYNYLKEKNNLTKSKISKIILNKLK